MKNKLLLIFCLFTLSGFAQQVPMFNQYFNNPFVYNPSMAGNGDALNTFLMQRTQWTYMPGAPVTRVLTADGPIKSKKIGLGITLFNDRTDILEQFGASLAYAYGFEIVKGHHLKLGLSLGVLDHRLDYGKIVVQEWDDQVISSQQNRRAELDGNFGLTYTWKDLEVGAAVPQLFANDVRFTKTNSRQFYTMARHYMASAKYTFSFMNDEIKAYPLVMVRYTPHVPYAPFQYDVNAVGIYKDFVWAGLSYKNNHAIAASAGVKLHNNLSIGYSYDFFTTAMGLYTAQTHEVVIGYTFGRKKDKEEERLLEDSLAISVDSLSGAPVSTEEKVQKLNEELIELRHDLDSLSEFVVEMRMEGLDEYSAEPTNKEIEKSAGESKDPVNGGQEEREEIIAKPAIESESKTGEQETAPEEEENFNEEKKPESGVDGKEFYVVIGSYQSLTDRDYANFKKKGFDVIYNSDRGFTYVYIQKSTDYATAKKELMKAQSAAYPDAWIYIVR